MSTGGWIMMICSWVFIIVLVGFCMRKVFALRETDAKHINPIHEIDTGDLNGKDGD